MTEQKSKEKTLNEMREHLEGSQWQFCIKVSEEKQEKQMEEYFKKIGNNSLDYLPNLISCYQDEPSNLSILNDLEENLKKIKNNELSDYHREMALDICDYLLKQQHISKEIAPNAERFLRP